MNAIGISENEKPILVKILKRILDDTRETESEYFEKLVDQVIKNDNAHHEVDCYTFPETTLIVRLLKELTPDGGPQ